MEVSAAEPCSSLVRSDHVLAGVYKHAEDVATAWEQQAAESEVDSAGEPGGRGEQS